MRENKQMLYLKVREYEIDVDIKRKESPENVSRIIDRKDNNDAQNLESYEIRQVFYPRLEVECIEL
ncbi:MAG: hypothetical protein AABW50_04045 [Nanoarchaeota archaeon]